MILADPADCSGRGSKPCSPSVQKGDRTARCSLIQYGHGLELRLDIHGEMRTTRLCRDQDEWLRLHVEWKQKLREKGWQE
jgi:hypothetical protein